MNLSVILILKGVIMKKLFAITLVSLSLGFLGCTSSRSTAIPTLLNDLSAALNAKDQDAFKRLIWTGAADYGTVQSGATQVSNLVTSGIYTYKYFFSNANIPTTTPPLTVKVDCVVASYSGTQFITNTLYSGSSESAKFEIVNASTSFTEDWKLSKIYLPGKTDPVIKAPGFIIFTGR